MSRSTFCMRWTLGLAVLAGLMLTYHADGYPEPRIVTDSWQIDFQFDSPRVISVVTEPGQPPQTFWYLPYTVTNDSGEDQMFIPDIRVLTNTGQVIRAGRDVPPNVFAAIKAEQRNKLLESPIEVIGRLLQGEDNAKDSVAIWPAADADVDAITITIKGLSGETTVVKNPETGKDIVLRKTLMLQFATPGGTAAATRRVTLLDTDWVMQ